MQKHAFPVRQLKLIKNYKNTLSAFKSFKYSTFKNHKVNMFMILRYCFPLVSVNLSENRRMGVFL